MKNSKSLLKPLFFDIKTNSFHKVMNDLNIQRFLYISYYVGNIGKIDFTISYVDNQMKNTYNTSLWCHSNKYCIFNIYNI